MLWTDKYSPKTTKEIVGQDQAMNYLKFFVVNFKKCKKKAVMLHGPTGSGKTSSVYALAKEFGYELLEVNASDTRNADSIKSILGSACQQYSLFGKSKLILVDELDGLSGMNDRGAVTALAEIIDKTAFPIIMIAGDPYDRKLSALKTKCDYIEFAELQIPAIMQLLSRIATNENITAPDLALRSLARRSGSDIRAAITDFQSLVHKTKSLSPQDILTLGERTQKEDVIQALMKIFKTTDPMVAYSSLDSLDEDMDTIKLWIDENLPREYTKIKDLARAYDALSKADIFNSRIRRWQYWRLLVYVHAMLTSGVALAKDVKYEPLIQYKQTMRLLRIWQLNMKNAKKKSISEKIADKTHCGIMEATKLFPYFHKMLHKNSAIADELDLDEEERTWIKTH